MREERRRKMVSAGAKTRLPTGERSEIGNPQLMRIGREIRVINSCKCRNVRSLAPIFLSVSGNIIIFSV
jgi:hypothetical protein